MNALLNTTIKNGSSRLAKFVKLAFLLPITLLILLSGYQSPSSSATKATEVKSQNSRPFHANLKTSIQITGTSPIRNVTSSGSGVVTHLGKTTYVANATVNFTMRPAQVVGTATFIAANGDEFYTSFSGNTTVINGTSFGHFEHTVTGGTGRFENITGSFIGTSVHRFTEPTGSLIFIGEIDY